MKWFKHQSDSLSDPFIQDLIHNFGGNGYMVWFGTIELISKENGKNVTGKSEFSGRFLKEKFHVSVGKLQEIFRFCEGKGKLLFHFSEKNFKLEIPKILEIKDNYSKDLEVGEKKPSNHNRGRGKRLEEDSPKGEKKKKDPPTKKQSATNPEEFSDTVKVETIWIEAYKAKFDCEPEISFACDRKLLKDLIAKHGFAEVSKRALLHVERGKMLTLKGFKALWNDLIPKINGNKKSDEFFKDVARRVEAGVDWETIIEEQENGL